MRFLERKTGKLKEPEGVAVSKGVQLPSASSECPGGSGVPEPGEGAASVPTQRPSVCGTWNQVQVAPPSQGSQEASKGAPEQQSLGGDLRMSPFPQLPCTQALAGPQAIALNTWLYLHLNRTNLSG